MSSFFCKTDGNRYYYPSSSNVRRCSSVETACSWTEVESNVLIENIGMQLDQSAINWDMVAVQLSEKFNKYFSPLDCLMRFRNVVNPGINNGAWSSGEERKLKEIVENRGQNFWVAVCEELGSHRTPVQCLRHFQQNFNESLINKENWTVEEDQLLKEAVGIYGTKTWQHVANCIPGRTPKQCTNRYSKICQDDLRRPWTADEERALFLAAIAFDVATMASQKKPSEDIERLLAAARKGEVVELKEEPRKKTAPWTEIAKYVPGRTDVQCREKWTVNLDPSVFVGPFSEEEDEALLLLVAYFTRRREEGGESVSKGRKRRNPEADQTQSEGDTSIPWTAVAAYMPGRTDASLRTRYLKLMSLRAADSGEAKSATYHQRRKKKEMVAAVIQRGEVVRESAAAAMDVAPVDVQPLPLMPAMIEESTVLPVATQPKAAFSLLSAADKRGMDILNEIMYGSSSKDEL